MNPEISNKLNYEESQGFLPWDHNTTVQEYILANAPLSISKILKSYESKLKEYFNSSHMETFISQTAHELFTQANIEMNRRKEFPDDRFLYWIRLLMINQLKTLAHEKGSVLSINRLVQLFEEGSRNYTTIDFSQAPEGCKKILITGFDPFLLNSLEYPSKHNIRQSNPSGCVALSLHNNFTGNKQGFFQSMLFPVRYCDFDGSDRPDSGMGKGVVERYIGPWIGSVDMIITISQGHPHTYAIDKFATITRGGLIDNMGHRRPEGSPCIQNGPSWICTTLPSSILKPPVIINESYRSESSDSYSYGLPKSANSKIFSGPGGNYLSNEIFYRVANLRELWREAHKDANGIKPEKFTGHFHIPKLQDPAKEMHDGRIGEDLDYTATSDLINQVKLAIANTI